MSQSQSFSEDSLQAFITNSKAFIGISKQSLDHLLFEIKAVRFDIGQILSEHLAISDNIYLIMEGNCRLLGPDKGRLTTLSLIGPGSFVGLASLLRVSPCELVSASSEVIAATIPASVIVYLYEREDSFRHWCNQQLWPCEVANLLHKFQQENVRLDGSPRDALAKLMLNAQIVPTKKLVETLTAETLEKGRLFYLGSANTDQQLGEPLNLDKPFPLPKPPFDLRVISLIVGQSTSEAEAKPLITETTKSLDIETAPLLPKRSDLELGQNSGFENFKIIRGEGPLEETLACFQMLSAHLKLPFRKDSIEKVLRDCLRRGEKPTIQLCGRLGAQLGLHVVGASVPATMASRLQTPSLLQWKDGFAIAIASNAKGLVLASPSKGRLVIIPEEFDECFPDGINFLILERAVNTPEQNFGPEWFLPALSRYKGVLLQVLIASFVVQLFGLANPLLIQVIIDKVISQRSLDTLQVLGIALVIVTLLGGILGSLRTFLFTETTNRIDQRLGAEVIDHLLRLPLNYFDKRPVGELSSRIAELEKIRNFLTGTALTTVLDAAFSVIYIIVMGIYSWQLTIVALIVLPVQVSITIIGAPLFRRQFRQAAEENARTQSYLVETLTGVQTVKAQNVEMVSRWKWQELYAKYIARTFEKTITGTAVQQASKVLQDLSQLLVLWVGAIFVLNGDLSLGQLIAFRIIAGYVTQPLLRLSTIWQNIQELRVSFERLADIIDTPLESNSSDQAKIPLPPVKGKVQFEDVTFAFQTGNTPVLKNINIEVESGTFVGIVGQSGSGKSTLMKLLPRLYEPKQGRVYIDGYDIGKVELYSLRRQIGIVPQDPLLFSGTVLENIALTRPDSESDAVVEAAKLACAHDFIMELPLGYSTQVGERGGALSGGQKQRIAIARTLLNKPQILVMDEATSALDYETERRVCDNLLENLKGCTVFFITHRLSAIRRADRVMMMHQGTVVENGDHDSLMASRGRYYALYRQQDVN